MSTIIGFTGKLGSGKDTAADRFELGLRGAAVVRGSFAEKLKVSAAACFPDVARADWEVWKNDPNIKILIVRENPTPYPDHLTADANDWEPFPADVISEQTARGFLQRYGTESHRDVFGQDFWVEQAFPKDDNYDVLVFTDVRFENEARAIRDRGGVVVRVKGANEQTGGHASEAGLPDDLVDYEIRNDVRGDGFLNLDMEVNLLAKKLRVPDFLFHPVGAVAS